jgi:hypothetical protein
MSQAEQDSAEVLTKASQLVCQHQLPIAMSPSTNKLKVGSEFVLVARDVSNPSFGCSNSDKPCVAVSKPVISTKLAVNGSPVLLTGPEWQTNMGKVTVSAQQSKLKAG